MAEYLAPGVYVEEIEAGRKPIEGVSISTTATVGVCERGPFGLPILITRCGEFMRWFGRTLNKNDLSNTRHALLSAGCRRGLFHQRR